MAVSVPSVGVLTFTHDGLFLPDTITAGLQLHVHVGAARHHLRGDADVEAVLAVL